MQCLRCNRCKSWSNRACLWSLRATSSCALTLRRRAPRLTGRLDLQSQGHVVHFQNLHRLIAVFFNVIGINEHAWVIPRKN